MIGPNDNAKEWAPFASETESPMGVAGRVSYIEDVLASDGRTVRVVELESIFPKITWRVSGYHERLAMELERVPHHIGGIMAVRYFGYKPTRAGVPYANYKVAFRDSH